MNFQRLKIFYTTTFDDPLAYPVDKEIMEGMIQAVSYFVNNHGAIAQEIEIPLLKQSSFIANHAIYGAMPNFMEYVTSGKVTHLNPIWETVKFFFGKSTFHFLTIAMSLYARNPLLFNEELMPHYMKLGQELAEEFDNILDENAVFLYPTLPTTAHYHHYGALYIANACYVDIFNVTGAPVTVCPTGFNKRTSMPQSIQIVARKHNDALTIACACELDKMFGGWIPPGNN